MIGYDSVRVSLDGLRRRLAIARCLIEAEAGLPAGCDLVGDWRPLLRRLGERFPVNDCAADYYLEEIAESRELGVNGFDDVPLAEIVGWRGFPPEMQWHEYSDLEKLAICLMNGRVDELSGRNVRFVDTIDTIPWETAVEIGDHWDNLGARLGLELPLLDTLDFNMVRYDLTTAGEPWNGLAALISWMAAETNNLFADVHPNLEDHWELALEESLDWDGGILRRLARLYAEAEAEIFGPVRELEEFYHRAPDETLRACLEIALGLGQVGFVVQDGEVIEFAPVEIGTMEKANA